MAPGAEPGEANNTRISEQLQALNPGEAEDKELRAVLSKDADLKALMAKNKNLDEADLVKVKTQVYILTEKDDELRNVLHIVCMNGNL